MTAKNKALNKFSKKEYMGNQKKEEEGKIKEGKGGKVKKKIMFPFKEA